MIVTTHSSSGSKTEALEFPNHLPKPIATQEKQLVKLRRLTTRDVRLSSLKVLALTLLERIECFDEEEASGSLDDLNLQDEVRRFEAELIRNALVSTGGRQRRAARLLGMKVTTLNTKIRRYRIKIDKLGVINRASEDTSRSPTS